MMTLDVDEDSLAGYKCLLCDMSVCKDDVSRRLDHPRGREVVCLRCDGF